MFDFMLKKLGVSSEYEDRTDLSNEKLTNELFECMDGFFGMMINKSFEYIDFDELSSDETDILKEYMHVYLKSKSVAKQMAVQADALKDEIHRLHTKLDKISKDMNEHDEFIRNLLVEKLMK